MSFEYTPSEAEKKAAELRADKRASLFLSGKIMLGAQVLPIRIRNMSTSGALIDGAVVPPVGAKISLKRGELQVEALVAWSRGGRCGLNFVGSITVEEWISSSATKASAEEQHRVDELHAQLRSGAQVVPRSRSKQVSAAVLNARLAEELERIREVLSRVADELAGEAVVLEKHGEAIQQFDILGQTLAHVARLMIAEDQIAEADKIGMESLKERLLA